MDVANILDILLVVVLVVVALAVLPAVAVLFLVFYIGRRIYYAIKGEPYVPLFGKKDKKYEHQDVDAGSTPESIGKVLSNYTRYDIVGKYARDGKSNLDSLSSKSQAFFTILDNKFQHGSLSWDKFAVGADTVNQAVVSNCALLANRIQTFDRADYRKLTRMRRDSSLKRGTDLTETQEEKLSMLEGCLADMDAIISSNERLLFEFDKLMLELNKLQSSDFNEEGERLLEEIRTLIEETKYYQQA